MYFLIGIGVGGMFIAMFVGMTFWQSNKKRAIVAFGIGVVLMMIAIAASPSGRGKSGNSGVYHYQDKDGNWNEIDMNDFHQDNNGNWNYQK